RTSQGQNCRTPCDLTVQVAAQTVTVALNGYETQTITVGPDLGGPAQDDPNMPAAKGSKLAPNPIFAQLQAVPPPVTAKKKPVRKKKKVNTAAPQAPAAAPAAAAPAPVAAEPAPAGATAYPWPSR